MKRITVTLALVLLAVGCRREPSIAVQVAKTPTASAQAVPAAPETEPPVRTPSLVTVSGVVAETLTGADYTYMRLETAEGEIWAAITKSSVKKGEKVTVVNAARMDGFDSKTLNRKFEKIVFGSLASGAEGSAPRTAAKSASAGPPVTASHAGQPDAAVRQQMAAQHAAVAAGPGDVGKIDVKRAEGSEGRTVAELFAQREAVRDREIAVRGKVVKFTPGVMGRNWIHLRDGSGSREKRNDDVTVTTDEAAAIGDVVLVRGTVRVDKDFGAGYAYPVLIDNAKLSK